MKIRTQIPIHVPHYSTDETVLHLLRDACLKRIADNQLYRRQRFKHGELKVIFGNCTGLVKTNLKAECILYRQVLKECFGCDFVMDIPCSTDPQFLDKIIFEIEITGERL